MEISRGDCFLATTSYHQVSKVLIAGDLTGSIAQMFVRHNQQQGNRILISEALRRLKTVAGSSSGTRQRQILDFTRA